MAKPYTDTFYLYPDFYCEEWDLYERIGFPRDPDIYVVPGHPEYCEWCFGMCRGHDWDEDAAAISEKPLGGSQAMAIIVDMQKGRYVGNLKVQDRTCEYCPRVFTPINWWNRFCSPACRLRSHRRKWG
mgnify:CR=1 FL=1